MQSWAVSDLGHGGFVQFVHSLKGSRIFRPHAGLGLLRSGGYHRPMKKPAAADQTIRVATADGASHRQQEGLSRLLSNVRRLFKMDVVFVSQFRDGRVVVGQVDAADPSHEAIRAGDSHALEDTYCHRVLMGRLPQVIPDTGALQELSGLAVTHALKIGSYLGVPIKLANGEVYGTLCCISHSPDPTLDETAAVKLRAIAIAVAATIENGQPTT